MEEKVLLFDSNDKKVGETFKRRAKQLVRQQRASWVNDSQEAIKFAPGMENKEADITKHDNCHDDCHGDCHDDYHDEHYEKWLVALAEKRLWERKFFKLYSVAFLPGIVIIFFFTVALGGAIFRNDLMVGLFLGFSCGAWVTAYGIHAYHFYKNWRQNIPRTERRERELAAEIAMLKAELK